MDYDFYRHGSLEYEDDLNILLAHQQYSEIAGDPFRFTYDYSDERLNQLRHQYQLDDIAGNGTQFIQLLRLTFWLSKRLAFGHVHTVENVHALAILSEEYNNYANCYIAATVLLEIFLSLGYVARMVRCLPIDLRYDECHCVTIAYINELKKFVAFDPAMGGCYIDNNGYPLNIADIRRYLISNEKFYIRSIFNIDQDNIRKYLVKNMIRFQVHEKAMYGREISSENDVFIHLNPMNIPIKTKDYINGNKHVKHIFINNDASFWCK